MRIAIHVFFSRIGHSKFSFAYCDCDRNKLIKRTLNSIPMYLLMKSKSLISNLEFSYCINFKKLLLFLLIMKKYLYRLQVWFYYSFYKYSIDYDHLDFSSYLMFSNKYLMSCTTSLNFGISHIRIF